MIKQGSEAVGVVDSLVLVANYLLRQEHGSIQAEQQLIGLLASSMGGGKSSMVDTGSNIPPLFPGLEGGEDSLPEHEAERVRLLRLRLFHHLIRKGAYEQAAAVATRVGGVDSAHSHVVLDGDDVFSDLHLAAKTKQAPIAKFALARSSDLFKEDAAAKFEELVLDELKMEDLGLEEVESNGIRLEAMGRLVEAGGYYDSMGRYTDSNRVHHYKSLMEQPLTGTMRDFEPVALKTLSAEAMARETMAHEKAKSDDMGAVTSSTAVRGAMYM